MATPRRGPSLFGPTGWTASTLTPAATVTATAPAILNAPVPQLQAQPLSPANTPTTDLSKYNLTDAELGLGGRGRNTMGGGRGTVTTPTPLESLLASIFPDMALGQDPSPTNPNTNAPQGGALFRTVLGNLGLDTAAPAAPAPVIAGPTGFGNQIASTIPGAPAFLGTAINNVTTAGIPTAAPAGGAGALNLAGLAALAAEQRAQQNQLAQEQAAANDAYFQQQQAQQRAQRMVAQRQRQRFGAPNAITSGWASSPVLF